MKKNINNMKVKNLRKNIINMKNMNINISTMIRKMQGTRQLTFISRVRNQRSSPNLQKKRRRRRSVTGACTSLSLNKKTQVNPRSNLRKSQTKRRKNKQNLIKNL